MSKQLPKFIDKYTRLRTSDAFVLSVYTNKHCNECLHVLEHDFSMRKFLALKETIAIINLYETANELDRATSEIRESNKHK